MATYLRCVTVSETPGYDSRVIEVEQKLDDIRETLKRDSLPFDMEER